jgi:hypothetical protein
MAFSVAPRLTQTQQVAFVRTWTGAAQRASQQLGIPYQWVLAQWAMETDYGTQPTMGANNPGNVGNLGHGRWQAYPSQAAFVRAYVASMRTDFAHQINAIQVERVSVAGRGGPPPVTLQQFFNGPQTYDPSTTTYGNNVANFLPSIEALTHSSAGTANPNLVATEPGATGGPGWLAGLEAWVTKEAVLVLLILGLIVLLVLLAAKGLGLLGPG